VIQTLAQIVEASSHVDLQTSEDHVTKWKWVDYSAFDAKATWDLFHSLREKLQATPCHVDKQLKGGIVGKLDYTQWDLYLDLLRPFGDLLTEMEDVRSSPPPRLWWASSECLPRAMALSFMLVNLLVV
jgi:hypothetical protein